ncbi:hypothetical protein [Nocardia sp. 348MFTsu5.1]|uniref:hypothetical protein n=1 Tax=Nocardia sp. 348MFTsu5.1 TaxID=1172185 RepID=UPI0003758B32|nr:hypothetical protein [Nocardia sp. 348MFTsu5.1]
MRYQLNVVARSVSDVVQHAGGFVYDRVMAGWDVTVILTDNCDTRPVKILGADVADLEKALATGGLGRHPQALAIAADLFKSDDRVQGGVVKAIESGNVEVSFWGDSWPLDSDAGSDSVVHQLSSAAAAFKSHALTAAAIPSDTADAAEVFHSNARLPAA